MGVVTVGELKPSISGKRSFRPSSSTRHVTEWPISDVSSDLTIEVGAASFSLHKFPLVSRSGRIRKLLLESKDPKISRINLTGVPGGSEAFELAAKFCYGVNTEITLSNVAVLRCAAHFLEMTEEFAEKNLEMRSEAYIKENVLPNISSSISVLHRCESLLPIAEDINLVNRIINAIANNACKEQLTSGLSKLEHNFPSKPVQKMETETPSDWWGKSLAVLNLDFFQRVLSAVKTKGLKQDMIGRILINYAHNSLQGIIVRDPQLVKGSLLDLELQKKQRSLIEAIVSLLPTQSRKSTVPMAFLSSLLKSAMGSSASTSCKSDLERRIGLQLDQAILEDILIPASSHGNNHSPIYDTDSIQRIFSIFLNLDEDDDEEDNHLRDESEMVYDFDSPGSPKQSSILKVSKLLDSYLAEVALDSNLMPSKFIALAELLPDHARLKYYLRTGTCKFGASCKFHHPRDVGVSNINVQPNSLGYPLRPVLVLLLFQSLVLLNVAYSWGISIRMLKLHHLYLLHQGENECSYYLKTGQCKFGMTCKFHHPQPSGMSMPSPAHPFYPTVQSSSIPSNDQYGGSLTSYRTGRPPLLPGSYPPGAYGPMMFPPGVVPIQGWSTYSGPVSPVLSPSAQPTVGVGSVYGVAQLSSSAPAFAGPYQSFTSSGGPSSSGQKERVFPERPGELACQYYLKTGDCKFGSSCRYHHSPDWVISKTNCVLSPLGLPLRPGVQPCAFYMQNGHCKFGPTCKFDHPIRTVRYSPSASSLTDIPVAPYMVGSSLTTLAPSFSYASLDPHSSRMPSSGNTLSSSAGLIFPHTVSAPFSNVQLSGQSSSPIGISMSTRQGDEVRRSS